MERGAVPRLEHVRDEILVVSLQGEYDMSNANMVDEALDSAFAAGSTAILDLRDVTFIDSLIMGVIAKARLRAIASGGAHRLAVVVTPNSNTERVLHVGLDHYIDIFHDLHAALTAMSAESDSAVEAHAWFARSRRSRPSPADPASNPPETHGEPPDGSPRNDANQ
jgi:anti-anti-sigma factor